MNTWRRWRTRTKVLVVGGVVVAAAALASASGTDSPRAPSTPPPASPGTTTTTEPTAVATPAPPPSAPGLGAAVEAGSWTITVNAVSPAQSDNQFIEPDPGNGFWVVDVTLVNNGAEPEQAGSGIRLQDDQDFTHDAEILGVKDPEIGGNVPAGATTRGYLTFQMATDAKPAAVLFQPDPFDGSIVVTIDVSP